MTGGQDLAGLPEKWWGEWISPVESGDPRGDRPAYLIERSFEVPALPDEARLFATALGVYEVYLNGARLGDDELAPGSSSYDRTLYAQAYAPREHLRVGENMLQVVLSDGWFRGRNGGGQHRDCWGDTTAVRLQLDVEHAGRRSTALVSDGTWSSRVSCIRRADLMTGQTTDFTAPMLPPEPVRVGAVSGPDPSASPAPPVRRIAELAVREWRHVSGDVSIADFGQNISGWVRLTDLGEVGAETTLEFGEHLDPSGDLDTAHLDTHTPRGQHIRFSQTDRVISDGIGRHFEPRHTIHGFRYARISHPGRTLGAEALTAMVVRSDLAEAGSFVSSDSRINQLESMARWSFSGNAVDVPTDCPTRERAGWTGDFQIFAPAAVMLFDIEGFAHKWLRAVRDDQFDDGCLSMISPDPLRMRLSDHPDRMGGGSAGWGDAAVAVPWTIYEEYGDERVLEESWGSAVAWVDFALGSAKSHRHASRVAQRPQPADHEQYIWDGPFHFGEWLEPALPGTGVRDAGEVFAEIVSADQGEVGTAYLVRSLRQLADAAAVLRRPADEARYRRLEARASDAWRLEFLRPDGRTALDTQAAYVRAISFGLVPEELRPSAVERLVELIRENDDHLGTGFLSTGMLLPVLADNGYAELAYRLLTRTGVPSWLEVAERGGTTFWENWDGVGADGRARSGSLNHYSKGAVVEFLYTHILGLRQASGSVGWRDFVVRPVFGGGLSAASGTHRTRHGEIRISWRRDDGHVSVTVTAPVGTRGSVHVAGREPVVVEGGGSCTVRGTGHGDARGGTNARNEDV